MKYLLFLLLTISPSFGQFFNAAIYDVSTGKTQIISGQVFEYHPTRQDDVVESWRKVGAIFDEIRERRIQEEQLYLLRQIANKQ